MWRRYNRFIELEPHGIDHGEGRCDGQELQYDHKGA